MKARLIAVGERAPAWVAQGFAEYQKRLSHWLPLELVEVEPGVRGKGRDTAKAMDGHAPLGWSASDDYILWFVTHLVKFVSDCGV